MDRGGLRIVVNFGDAPCTIEPDLGDRDGELLFATSDGVRLAPDDAQRATLRLSPHAGAVVAPVGG
jgi:hypothetical protein